MAREEREREDEKGSVVACEVIWPLVGYAVFMPPLQFRASGGKRFVMACSAPPQVPAIGCVH